MGKQFTTENTTPSGWAGTGKVYRRPDPTAPLPTPVKTAIKKRLKR